MPLGLHYLELKILRRIKQCRIEAPPFNVLQQENRVGGKTSKSFEAALRILKIEVRYYYASAS
jgi:hypothetical protein